MSTYLGYIMILRTLYPLDWWAKHESMFPTITFMACQIFGVVGS
jgi:hypothetical protein